MSGEMIPIIAIITVFTYLGWKRYLAHQERLAALQRGVDPRTVAGEDEKEEKEKGKETSRRASRDPRLGSMIWIAVGLAFMVAAFFSVGMTKGMEKGVATAVWGIIPLTVGAVRYAYHASAGQEEPDCYRRSAVTLIAVGLSYMICVTLSTGMFRGAERAVAAGVWGIIPFAIGVAMFVYSGMVRKERDAQGLHRGEEGG